jgi:Zn-dependent protease with chaperone function
MAAAGFMVLLPAVYLGLIAVLTWGACSLALHPPGMDRSLLLRTAWALGVAVAVALIGLLVKPLTGGLEASPGAVTLDRRVEPALFEFVEALSRVIGAPLPTRIDVDWRPNATAARTGPAGLGRGFVLTLGLPLLLGLSLRQLVGVVAHELGHFRQGTGFLAANAVSLVGRWFRHTIERCTRREGEFLRMSDDGVLSAVLGVCLATAVRLPRRILEALLSAGERATSALYRQGEHEADRYEALLVGSDTFVSTMRRLTALQDAAAAVPDLVRALVLRGGAPDDVAGLTVALSPALDPQEADALASSWDTPDPLNSHPASHDRIRRALAEPTPGCYRPEGPARVLLTDRRKVAHDVSMALYREVLGESEAMSPRLRPLEECLPTAQSTLERQSAWSRVGRGLVHETRLVFFDYRTQPPLSLERLLASLRRARGDFERTLPRARRGHAWLCQAHERARAAEMASHLSECGFRVPSPDPNEPDWTEEGVLLAQEKAETLRRKARGLLEPWEAALRDRLLFGVAVALHSDGSPLLTAARLSADDLRSSLKAMRALQAAYEDVLRLSEAAILLDALLLNQSAESPNDGLHKAVQVVRHDAATLLRTIHDRLACRLDPAARPDTAAGRATRIAVTLTRSDPASVLATSLDAVERYRQSYEELMGQFATLVEMAESWAG